MTFEPGHFLLLRITGLFTLHTLYEWEDVDAKTSGAAFRRPDIHGKLFGLYWDNQSLEDTGIKFPLKGQSIGRPNAIETGHHTFHIGQHYDAASGLIVYGHQSATPQPLSMQQNLARATRFE